MGAEKGQIPLAFGRLLAAERRAVGMSQADLAAAAGFARQRVNEWERGAYDPTLSTLIALARALGCGVAELVPAEDSEKNLPPGRNHT